MTILGPLSLAHLLLGQGFSSDGAVMGIAIIMKESGGNTNARNHNSNGSIDRGIWQWNNRAHPDISDACAFDPVCATQKALSISGNGSNWGPWNPPSYKNGTPAAAVPFIPMAKAAVLAAGPLGGTPGKTQVTVEQAKSLCPDCAKTGALDILALTPEAKKNQQACRKCLDAHFGKGNYEIDLGSAQLPAPHIPIVSDVANAIMSLANLIGALFKGSTWIRIAEVVGGLFLIGIGLYMISKDLGLSSVEEATKKYPGIAKAAGAASRIRGG